MILFEKVFISPEQCTHDKMALNKTRGNMYGFVSHTWNPVGGQCEHNCKYCYIKNSFLGGNKYNGEPYIADLETNLGSDNTIFVGSATDIFADNVSDQIIRTVLDYCERFDNTYIYQSKNPDRFHYFIDKFPKKSILTTTIETNKEYINLSDAPRIKERKRAMKDLPENFESMITIEPIVDFDLKTFLNMLKEINPDIITIGADSGKNNLPEPDKYKIEKLIDSLKNIFEVRLKHNLKRLRE